MSKLPNKKEAITYLKSNGWEDWYNPNYWVHPKTVKDSSCQDYTKYGMDWKSAYLHEKYNLPPFIPTGFPALGKMLADKPDFTSEEWDWLEAQGDES